MNWTNLAICAPIWLGASALHYLLFERPQPIWVSLLVGCLTGAFFPIFRLGDDR